MKDSRDGKTYRTIKIGKQIWMAENLNYADSVATPSLKGNCWCYDTLARSNDVTSCFYTWTAAIDSVKLATDLENPQTCGYGYPCRLSSQVQGICPDGWHLPSYDEWKILLKEVGGGAIAGKALKSQIGWMYSYQNGTDAFGFSAVLVDYNSDGYVHFWSSSQYSTSEAFNMCLTWDKDASLYEVAMYADLNVRCLKNDTLSAVKNFTPVFDSITDSRDGKSYKTVVIGKQTWMAENLNYADSISTTSLKGNCWCYDDEEKNCDKYGRLYTWAAAVDSAKIANDVDNPMKCGYEINDEECSLPSRVRGICPDGWHLPNNDEWDSLFNEVLGEAGMVLKSNYGWRKGKDMYGIEHNNGNGSDSYGFSVLPAGVRSISYNPMGEFEDNGEYAYFWSSTQYSDFDGEYAYNRSFAYYSDEMYWSFYSKGNGYSIRCIKD